MNNDNALNQYKIEDDSPVPYGAYAATVFLCFVWTLLKMKGF